MVEEQTTEKQAKFRASRVYVDQTFAFRKSLEQRCAFRKPAVFVFLKIHAGFGYIGGFA